MEESIQYHLEDQPSMKMEVVVENVYDNSMESQPNLHEN